METSRIGWMVAEWDWIGGCWQVEGTAWTTIEAARRERDEMLFTCGGRWAVAEVTVDEATTVGEP